MTRMALNLSGLASMALFDTIRPENFNGTWRFHDEMYLSSEVRPLLSLIRSILHRDGFEIILIRVVEKGESGFEKKRAS